MFCNFPPRIPKPAPFENRGCERGEAIDQLVHVSSLLCIRLGDKKVFQINKKPGWELPPVFCRELVCPSANDALDSSRQLVRRSLRVARNIAGCVFDCVVHQVVRRVAVVQVGPGTEGSIRPGCLSSGFQLFIGSGIPGRIDGTPLPLLPDTSSRWHTRAPARGGIVTRCCQYRRRPRESVKSFPAGLPQISSSHAFSKCKHAFDGAEKGDGTFGNLATRSGS